MTRLIFAIVLHAEPGGYLQWSEHNLATMTVESVKPGIKNSELQYLADHARDAVKSGSDSVLLTKPTY